MGPYGFKLLNVGLDSSTLRMVSTLSLALVLFTDALTLDLQETKKHAKLAALILGPGTVLAAALIGVAAHYLLGLPWTHAAILAAPLASTDPVLLRGLLRRPDLPGAARQALRLESGLNDVVLLPIVLVAMAFVANAGEAPNFTKLGLEMLVGPVAGVVVAWVGIKALEIMRAKVGVRRDYESLYSLGIALAAFAAAEAIHSSGFLAAFAAGLTIAAIDVELCDCFREYGETTAEMLLLFTFVLLGGSLMWTGLDGVTLAIAAFVILALAARPLALSLALLGFRTEPGAKRVIVWFGPRGLSSLLLILVPVFASTPGSERLFQISTLVVLVSIAMHGGSIMAFGKRGDRVLRRQEVSGTSTASDDRIPELLTPSQVRQLIAQGEQVWLLDVRSQNSFLNSDQTLATSVRIDPQQARREAIAVGVPKEAWAALFCT